MYACARQQALSCCAGSSGPAPRVYSYSVFHPFFEQYLTIAGDAVWLLAFAGVAVLLVTLVITGSLWLAVILLLCLTSILLGMLGCMVLFSIQLNAVSLVNLVMSLGIGVEFLAHIAHSFLIAAGTRYGLSCWLLVLPARQELALYGV